MYLIVSNPLFSRDINVVLLYNLLIIK